MVSPKGARKVFQQTTAEIGETTTVPVTINAAGDAGLSLVIFKGQCLSDDVRRAIAVTCMIAMSANGWIMSEIFLDFLEHFMKIIPAERPIMMLMDSHSSHVAPGKDNGIVFQIFPSHTTHLLQPLDVGIYEDVLVIQGSRASKKGGVQAY